MNMLIAFLWFLVFAIVICGVAAVIVFISRKVELIPGEVRPWLEGAIWLLALIVVLIRGLPLLGVAG